jgi:ribulose-phosphate 3-epimerase
MNVKIAASIHSADFSRLGEQVQEAIHAGAEYIHVDVMDGHFVPNMTIGPLVLTAIRPIAARGGVTLDVHLMIESPERLIGEFVQAGAQIITVHVETCPHLNRTVQMIHELGARAGVTLNPATSLTTLDEILPDVDQVLIMSVNPGFGGQKFLPASLGKIARLREMLRGRNLDHVDIEVDGGLKPDNVADVVRVGANILVSGSAIFNQSANVAENIAAIRSQIPPQP